MLNGMKEVQVTLAGGSVITLTPLTPSNRLVVETEDGGLTVYENDGEADMVLFSIDERKVNHYLVTKRGEG